jgi:hypothetical protein
LFIRLRYELVISYDDDHHLKHIVCVSKYDHTRTLDRCSKDKHKIRAEREVTNRSHAHCCLAHVQNSATAAATTCCLRERQHAVRNDQPHAFTALVRHANPHEMLTFSPRLVQRIGGAGAGAGGGARPMTASLRVSANLEHIDAGFERLDGRFYISHFATFCHGQTSRRSCRGNEVT